MSRAACQARNRIFQQYYGFGILHNSSQIYPKVALHNEVIETANAINCHQEEIIFTASGTEANNIALEGLPKAFLCTVPIKFITSSFTGVVALMSQYIFLACSLR